MVKMREGAWYRRRDGKVVGPAMPMVNPYGYPWRAGNGTYTPDGLYSICDAALGRRRDEDLIEEVPAPDAAFSAPIPGFPGDLRDWFAGLALTEAMKDYEAHNRRSRVVAEIAFKVADAMMAQRNKEKAE